MTDGERIQHLEQLVLHLADWCAYQQSGCADPERKDDIETIRRMQAAKENRR